VEQNRAKPSLEEGGGEEFLHPLFDESPWRDEMSSLRAEVEEAYHRFWLKDQVCGFTPTGERIGTGIPRKRPSYKSHDYSL
jgi:hypothetical protein